MLENTAKRLERLVSMYAETRAQGRDHLLFTLSEHFSREMHMPVREFLAWVDKFEKDAHIFEKTVVH